MFSLSIFYAIGQITPDSTVFKYPGNVSGLRLLFSNIIAFFTIIGGLIFLYMLVTGGISYMTSGGDPKATSAAQARITHGIIGLAILALATVIIGIVSTFLGVEFLKLPFPVAP